MKLYKPEEKEVIRIDIKGGKNNSTCLTLIDTDKYAALSFVKEALKDTYYHEERNVLSPIPKLTVSCYEAKGNKKGKSKSTTVYGLSADILKNILIDKLSNLNNG